MKKIVITGFDMVSGAGIGLDEFSANILENRDYSSDIGMIMPGDVSCKKAFIVNINFEEFLGKTGLKHINRNAKLAFSAVERKLAPCFMNLPPDEKPGLILGTAFGSVDSICSYREIFLLEGNNSLRPLEFPNTVINSVSSFINIRYELGGISATISTGFNSSLDAFIYAHDYINNGYGDFLIVGGCEELGKYIALGQEKSGVLSGSVMHPFGKKRDGYIPGEGGAFFIVESHEHALKRNAVILAELAGFSSIYSHDINYGPAKAYDEALDMACIKSHEIDLVSSSANGGGNDPAILASYKKIFGAGLSGLSVAVHKKYFGECYGASGALQLAACLSNAMKGKVSPFSPDGLLEGPSCFSNVPQEKKIRYFSVDGLSCEGNNAVLIFKNRI